MYESAVLTLALLRRELTGDSYLLPAELDEEILRQVLFLSSRHDLGHIAGAALDKTEGTEAFSVIRDFRRLQHLALYRCEYIAYELERTCAALNAEKIPHMLLKGAHIRRYYPSPEMRTSSDIDLLVKTEDLARAVHVLTEQVGYAYVREGSHDVLFRTSNGMYFELHFVLTDAEQYRGKRDISDAAWESAVLLEECEYSYIMSPEMLFFHHIAHMAKHFMEGGCGIRFFMDLWILKNRAPACDMETLRRMLSESGLTAFSDAVCALAEVWFSAAAPTALTDRMAEFVLSGGVYGSTQNRTLVKRANTNRFSYLLSRLFLPYDTMKYQYPVLKKHAWLLPFCEIHRWFRLLSGSTAKRIKNEIEFNNSVTAQTQAETRALLDQLGL